MESQNAAQEVKKPSRHSCKAIINATIQVDNKTRLVHCYFTSILQHFFGLQYSTNIGFSHLSLTNGLGYVIHNRLHSCVQRVL
jgi:hypothetical protein